MEIKGKIVLITGIARVGSVVAEALAERGARIALSYRSSKNAADETIARIEARGGEARAFQGDLSVPIDAIRVVEETLAAFGGLDVLINMASMYKSQPFDALDNKAWDDNIASDARSDYLTSITAAKHMKQNGGGRIINFADWLAASGRPGYREFIPYYTAKSAVVGLTQALALELAPHVLVNAIAPGPILAPPDLSQEEVHEVEQKTPVGRWGGPAEIAKAVCFLIETDFVTGECIRVDGGRHLC